MSNPSCACGNWNASQSRLARSRVPPSRRSSITSTNTRGDRTPTYAACSASPDATHPWRVRPISDIGALGRAGAALWPLAVNFTRTWVGHGTPVGQVDGHTRHTQALYAHRRRPLDESELIIFRRAPHVPDKSCTIWPPCRSAEAMVEARRGHRASLSRRLDHRAVLVRFPKLRHNR